jgi:hypothetical protein
VLFRRATLERIAAGEVTVAFRRWHRPTVKPGGQLRTAIGVLAIDSVEEVQEPAITAEDAARAGYASVEELLANLAPDGVIYRVTLRRAGDDPRIARRETIPDDLAEVARAVAKIEGGARILRMIADRPATRAPDLAADFGLETLVFKRRVRRLKELGLTESLAVGYRLSPRGIAVLSYLETSSSSPRA